MNRLVSRPLSPKKPKGKPLSDADKMLNHSISNVRVRVEHAIAGTKRCRIAKDIIRNTKAGVSALVMEIACALHNLRVEYRYPQAVLNLYSPVNLNYLR